MKRFSVLLSFIVMLTGILLISGCSKDDPAVEPGVLKPSIKFNSNGINYNWPTDYAAIMKFDDSSFLFATDSPMGIVDSALFMLIRTDSLREQTYTHINAIEPAQGAALNYYLLNNLTYASSEKGDFGIVSIIDIHDSLCDGTFSALLTNLDSTMEKLNIINGEFKNLRFRQ
jgi:hypothetical protein